MTPAGTVRSAQQVFRATGLLRTFNEAGVLAAADVHVAQRLGRLGREQRDEVLLAVAVAVRAVRSGSVCVELDHLPAAVPDGDGEAAVSDGKSGTAALPWPAGWRQACETSPLVAVGIDAEWRPLRLVDGLLYLDRFWRQEQTVRRELAERDARTAPAVDLDVLQVSLARLFPAPAPDRQRLTCALAALRWVTVLAGGPGTGKTTTVARLLALLYDQPGPAPLVALAAPTGKAAARLQESVQSEAARLGLPAGLTASTLHRLLGWRPDSRSRFRHDRDNHLPHDVVIVDETSMVSLTLMSRLLEAVRPDARLVLVGDPDQLASVEAGAVLGDLVARPTPRQASGATDVALKALAGDDLEPAELASPALRNGVVRLTRVHRFGGGIALLAEAVRRGDPDEAVQLLTSGAADLELVAVDQVDGLRADVLGASRPMVQAALAGDAAAALAQLDRHRLLCAHRLGPYGVAHWAQLVGQWLAAGIQGYRGRGEWTLGRPVLVTGNDYDLNLYNGDSGVVVAGPDGPLVAFGRAGGPLLLRAGRLPVVQTVHAMTVHRGQGSQFARVSVILPTPDSPLLTRELLYTALTRARTFVRLLGTEQSVRAAVERPVVRASGLRRVILPLTP